MKRTHLPFNGLRVMDATARHLSFTRAADELAVTPAAVGQQIRALEDTLGVVLFRRNAKGLELTPEATAGLEALRDGFLKFEEAVHAMQAGQSSKRLTIATPRDFTDGWLSSRLASYHQNNPDIHFTLLAAEKDLDFTQANLDIAIRYTDDPGNHEAVTLSDGLLVTVGLPNAPEEFIGWPDAEHDHNITIVIQVADAGLAIAAALNGFGRCQVPLILAKPFLEAKKLQQFGPIMESEMQYWLMAPLPQWRQKKVKSLVTALTAELKTEI
ncbi:MAG: LysR family transcriptional regulator [Zymomonas mobilis subsp. pomaceae]|uniref:LysR family transcriptional regulator n=1 Tax=Zymomonas mobilis TaxID=542 RepID=UPI0039EA796D